MSPKKVCARRKCGEKFEANRKHQRFCSAYCRVAAWKDKQHRRPNRERVSGAERTRSPRFFRVGSASGMLQTLLGQNPAFLTRLARAVNHNPLRKEAGSPLTQPLDIAVGRFARPAREVFPEASSL